MIGNLFDELLGIIRKVRKECPWDREQKEEDICRYFLEEVYELRESLKKGAFEEILEESSDLLFLLLFFFSLFEEEGKFEIKDVFLFAKEKMMKMHPHVFFEEKAENSHDVFKNWCKKKKDALEGVPKSLPALLRAKIVQQRVAALGFDHRNIEEVKEKVLEEIQEFLSSTTLKMKEELGDILFSLVNLARFLGIDAEDALQDSVGKFLKRFRYIEEELKKEGKKPEQIPQCILDELWNSSKEVN